MRRNEARTETSERVVFRKDDALLDGWALNTSRGGVRAILEEKVELGDEFEVRCGGDVWRPGRVVWIQDEPDGVVVGVAYLDARISTVAPSELVNADDAKEAEPTPATQKSAGTPPKTDG